MGISDEELATMVMQGEQLIAQVGEVHAREWGLGTAERWSLDQEAGTITWTFADKTAVAPAQILGSYHAEGGSWLWAWANGGIRPAMSADARRVREWGEQNGLDVLAQDEVECDADTANSMIALAVRITTATGFYKGGSVGAIPMITFGPVTLTFADGTTRTMELEVG